jgi:rhodanese-related sulfurtransferase/ubiquinone/menaquinone biosynthesis C-methylase UbiE
MSTHVSDRVGAAPQVDRVADFIESLQPSSVLDAGCGSGDVAVELQRRGIDVVGIDIDHDVVIAARSRSPLVRWEHADLAGMQFDHRFDVVAFTSNALVNCEVHLRRAVLHTAVQHLLPGGALVSGIMVRDASSALTVEEYDALCADCDLQLSQRWATWDREPYEEGAFVVSVHRRSTRHNVHDMLFDARGAIQRVTPRQLMDWLQDHDSPLVVDTRTTTDRVRFGVIDGAIHVPRTVVEWHLDPANGYPHPAVTSFDQPIVVVCNGGYSSSLSAANLVRIGFTNVADMIGGMAAWQAAGLPTVPPTHSHLDF